MLINKDGMMEKLRKRRFGAGVMGLVMVGLLTILACGEALTSGTQPDYASLKTGFANPSGTARPKVYWWWLNGYVDRERIKEELQSIKDAGIGGVDIFEIGFRPDGVIPAGPAFMSDSSLYDIAFAITEAGKLDLDRKSTRLKSSH